MESELIKDGAELVHLSLNLTTLSSLYQNDASLTESVILISLVPGRTGFGL